MSRARSRRPRLQSGDVGLIGVALVIVLVMLFGVASVTLGYTGERTRTCTVTGKDRTTGHDGTSDMRVYTADCGTLRVKDKWFKGAFDSADVYAGIEPGVTYAFRTVGHRVPVVSMFPTILSAEPVT